MMYEDIDSFADDLSFYLKSRYKYKHPNIEVCKRAHRVFARKRKYSLMFRWRPINADDWQYGQKNTLVIAGIEFHKMRVGNGTDLLKFVAKFSKKYGYERVILEAANSCSQAFGKKFGFQAMNGMPETQVASVVEIEDSLRACK